MPETDLLRNTEVETTFQRFHLLNMVSLKSSGEVSTGSQELRAPSRLWPSLAMWPWPAALCAQRPYLYN